MGASDARVAESSDANLDGDNPLARGGHAIVNRDERRDARRKAKTPQARSGQHEEVVAARIELAQAGVEIPPHVFKRCARKPPAQLRDPPHAAGADAKIVHRRSSIVHRQTSIDDDRRSTMDDGRSTMDDRRALKRLSDPRARARRQCRAHRATQPACPCCCEPRGRCRLSAARPRFP